MRKAALLRSLILLVAALALLSAVAVMAQDEQEFTDNPANPITDNLSELPEPTESGYASVNDIEMYYATYGEGDPLLLIHGGLGNADYFANQIPAFVDAGYRVITADSRGHGRSSVTETPINYALMASDYLALLDFLEIDSVDLVGWSDGGIIGLEIAIHHPERLNKVVAYGANYVPSGLNPDIGTNDVFNAYIEQTVLDYGRLSPTPDGFDAFLANISNMWATEPNYSEEQMQSITVPFLFLDGWEEEAILPEHNFEMSRLVPGSELTLMPDVGHFAMFQTPEMFNSIVLNYLGR